MIYLDNFRSTMVAPEVWETMRTAAIDEYAVPAAFTQCGTGAAELIERAQDRLATAIGASQNEVVFTGSGTEAINIALWGGVWAQTVDKPEIVTSEIEYPATLAVYRALEKEGYLTAAEDAASLVELDVRTSWQGAEVARLSLATAHERLAAARRTCARTWGTWG